MKRMKNLVICQDTEDSRNLMNNINLQGFIKYRFVDGWNSNVDKWIWRGEVCILTMRQNATSMIVVKPADLAAIERFNFYQIWDKLKE